jgi:hypothetical protein
MNEITSQYILCDALLRNLVNTISAPMEIFHPEHANIKAVIKQLEDHGYIITVGTFIVLTPEGEYFIKKRGGYANQLPQKYNVKWHERYRFWDKFIWAFVTALFSLGVGIFLWQISSQEKNSRNYRGKWSI